MVNSSPVLVKSFAAVSLRTNQVFNYFIPVSEYFYDKEHDQVTLTGITPDSWADLSTANNFIEGTAPAAAESLTISISYTDACLADTWHATFDITLSVTEPDSILSVVGGKLQLLGAEEIVSLSVKICDAGQAVLASFRQSSLRTVLDNQIIYYGYKTQINEDLKRIIYQATNNGLDYDTVKDAPLSIYLAREASLVE